MSEDVTPQPGDLSEVDLSSHPYFVLCDEARCSPDSFQGRPGALAERWAARTGGSISVAKVSGMEIDFWNLANSSAVHQVTTRSQLDWL